MRAVNRALSASGAALPLRARSVTQSRTLSRALATAPPATISGSPNPQRPPPKDSKSKSKPGIDLGVLVGGAAAIGLIAGVVYNFDRIKGSAATYFEGPPATAATKAPAAAKTSVPQPPLAKEAPTPTPAPTSPSAEDAPAAASLMSGASIDVVEAKEAIAELDAFLIAQQLVVDEGREKLEVAAAVAAAAAAAVLAPVETASHESTPEQTSLETTAATTTTEDTVVAPTLPDGADGFSPTTLETAAAPLQPQQQHQEQPLRANLPPEAAALSVSRGWLADRMGDILQQELAGAVLGGEVVALSVEELRERILRLSSELSQRSKWEALHLKALVEENDKQWVATVRGREIVGAGARCGRAADIAHVMLLGWIKRWCTIFSLP